MNYILLCEGFNDWCENNPMPAMSRLLWFDLVHLFNRRGWCEWLQVSNQRLMDGLQLTREQTFISIRDKLIEKGLFLYEKGKKRNPSKYKFNTKLTFISVAENGVKSVVQPVVNSGVFAVGETVTRTSVDICSVTFAQTLGPINNLLEMVNINKAEVARNPAWHIFLAKNNFGKTTQYVDQVQQQISVNNPLDEMSDDEILKAAQNRPKD